MAGKTAITDFVVIIPLMARYIEGEKHLEETLAESTARAEKYFPGARFVSVYSHKERQMVIVPIGYAMSPRFGHAVDYGSGVFEGSSAVVNERTGKPGIILLSERNARLFRRSLPARGYTAPIPEEEFGQAMIDLIKANGMGLFRHPDNKTPGFVRAYIRPSIHPAFLSGFGISMRPDYPIDAAIIAWAWPDYLNPTLMQRGGVCAVTGLTRSFPITGKHASNYGAAAMDGALARKIGADELLYLAPYLIDKDGHRYFPDPNDLTAKLRDGVIADGPGEECVALTADQKTLVYAPMRVNRLGGTVLQYIIDHLAKNIGLDCVEGDISLHDLTAGKYAGLAMVGNAVKVTPIRRIDLYNGGVTQQIELFAEGKIPENLESLRVRWEQETRGLIDPSHPSLLTEVPRV